MGSLARQFAHAGSHAVSLESTNSKPHKRKVKE